MTVHNKKQVSVISAPFSGGQGRGGVDDGPRYLLEMGLQKEVETLGYDVDVEEPLSFVEPTSDEDIGKMKRPRFVADATRKVYEAVSAATKKGKIPLTLGGDHSIAIGTVAGVQEAHPDAVLLWIDAHADLNTPESTDSGNLHGCPVSFLLGIAGAEEKSNPFSWVPKCIDNTRIGYIGLRDLDAFEKKYIRENNITAYTMHHVDKYGIAKVVSMALERLNPGNKRPVHLSFDIDAIDPFFAPSTGTPVRGGLTLREACYLCETVAETNQLVAMDLVECNPHLGASEKDIKDTIALGLSMVKCAFGDALL